MISFSRQIPPFTSFRLKYLTVAYKDTVVANAQTSPNLTYKIYDATGTAYQIDPILIKQVTGPAGFPGLDATHQINFDYPGKTKLLVEVFGQNVGAELPETASICCIGMLGWQWKG